MAFCSAPVLIGFCPALKLLAGWNRLLGAGGGPLMSTPLRCSLA